MNFIIKEFTEEDAIKVCNWKYEYPYDVYNFPSWEIVKNQSWAMAEDEKRKRQFHSVYEGDELAGYFRLVDYKEYSLLGLGLKPEACGMGNGLEFMKLILEYVSFKNEKHSILLEVREFNKRAIRCYKKAGFLEKNKYVKETLMGKDDFILMEFKY